MQQPLQHSQCSWPSHSPSSASCSVSSVDSPTHPRATSWAAICHCSFISSAACTVKQVQIFSITTDQISLVNFCKLPCIMWLIIYKPRRFSLSWLTNWVRITRMQCNWVPRVSLQHHQNVSAWPLLPFPCVLHVLQICIVIGVLLMVLSPIGGLRQMILKIKTYKFYQDYSGLSHN